MESTKSQLLPWHQEIWNRLHVAHRDGRLPHALLFAGAEGLGKRRFAEYMAHALFCESPTEEGYPCGNCRGCHLYQVGNHPDYLCIEPEEPGKAIKIDTIRSLVDKGGLTAQAGGYKVIVIDPADAMNIAAANSLLKTLEEPVAWTVMILITGRISRLPATIRSRCQQITFPVPSRTLAAGWLEGQVDEGDLELLLGLANGAPLKALALAGLDTLQERGQMVDEFYGVLRGERDPVVVAGRWEKLDIQAVTAWLAGWLIDMLRLKASQEPPRLYNPDQLQRLQSMAQGLDFKVIYGLLDRVYEANRTRDSQLNSLMMLESLLLALANSRRQTRV
jgi:DNA polymerase-3 subunit delta'